MKTNALLGLVLGASLVPMATAETFDLELTADDGSRFYDYYSAVYAELGADAGEITNPQSSDFGATADGYFLVSDGTKVGSGVVVFPSGGSFLDIGSLTFDELTGAVSGLELDFASYINDDDTLLNMPYTTTVSNLSGSVSTFDGGVTGIDLTSDITFGYQSIYGDFDFAGTFTITGDRFDLFVDDTVFSPLIGEYRLAWDVEGDVSNLSAVPEPSVYAMLFSGALVAGAFARRRKTQAC